MSEFQDIKIDVTRAKSSAVGKENGFTPAELDVLERLRAAFDPDGLANPGKMFPTPTGTPETELCEAKAS